MKMVSPQICLINVKEILGDWPALCRMLSRNSKVLKGHVKSNTHVPYHTEHEVFSCCLRYNDSLPPLPVIAIFDRGSSLSRVGTIIAHSAIHARLN